MNQKTELVLSLHKQGWSLRNIANEVGLSLYTVRSIITTQSSSNLAGQPTAAPSPSLSGIMDVQLRRQEKSIVKRFNLMVDELVDNSDDCDWNTEEWDDFIHNAKRLKGDIEDLARSARVSYKELAIHNHTEQIISSMSQVYDEYESEDEEDEDVICFDLPESRQHALLSLKVEDFYDEYEGLEGTFSWETGDDEDEDY